MRMRGISGYLLILPLFAKLTYSIFHFLWHFKSQGDYLHITRQMINTCASNFSTQSRSEGSFSGGGANLCSEVLVSSTGSRVVGRIQGGVGESFCCISYAAEDADARQMSASSQLCHCYLLNTLKIKSPRIPIGGEEKESSENEFEMNLFQKAIDVALQCMPIQKEGRIALGKKRKEKKKGLWCKLSMVRKVCPLQIARRINCDNGQAFSDRESCRIAEWYSCWKKWEKWRIRLHN